LQIDAADSPAAGSTYASTLSNFGSSGDSLDLRGVTFVSGATASVSTSGGVSTLVVTDGGTFKFKLAGTHNAYTVTSDGHGGTLIKDPPVIHHGWEGEVAWSGAQAAFAQAFSLLTDPAAPNFLGDFGASGGVQSSGPLDLAAAHNRHG
jgi:hypothetical protein